MQTEEESRGRGPGNACTRSKGQRARRGEKRRKKQVGAGEELCLRIARLTKVWGCFSTVVRLGVAEAYVYPREETGNY